MNDEEEEAEEKEAEKEEEAREAAGETESDDDVDVDDVLVGVKEVELPAGGEGEIVGDDAHDAVGDAERDDVAANAVDDDIVYE